MKLLLGLNPKTILDLGCGPGNSTKVLKDKFPNAKVIGADNSDEMLEKARQLYPEIEFIHLDASGDFHEVSGKFDIVFSNACIQWIPNHHSLLPMWAVPRQYRQTSMPLPEAGLFLLFSGSVPCRQK